MQAIQAAIEEAEGHLRDINDEADEHFPFAAQSR